MKIEIKPSHLRGKINAPPSKSMAHRLLICAGLAGGESVIDGISNSEDMLATLDLLQGLGAKCEKNGQTVRVTGVDVRHIFATKALNCRECGSTLRFFIPICLLSNTPVTLCGSPRLFARPLGIYEELCRSHGLFWEQNESSVTLKGPLDGGVFDVAGNVSSQFISGLLFALPLCKEDSVIRILPSLESKPYIDMTVEALSHFGVCVEWIDGLTLRVRGGQTYKAQKIEVEGDYSNAAFFEALRYLGHDVTVDRLNPESLQGDKIYTEYFKALDIGTPTLSLGQCPDLGPVLMALAAAKNGAHLRDTERLAIKESDRGAAMAEELLKLGVRVDLQKNDIIIPTGGVHAPAEELCGHNDHRIVMALAVLLTRVGGVITEAEAVRKSLPDFFDLLRSLGAEVKYYEAE